MPVRTPEQATRAETSAHLVVTLTTGPDAVYRQTLVGAGPWEIGRDPCCALHVPDPTLSRRHAALRWHAGRIEIRDLGSRHGTVLAGEAISGERWTLLPEGQPLRLGGLTLQVHSIPEIPALSEIPEPSEGDDATLVVAESTGFAEAATLLADAPARVETPRGAEARGQEAMTRVVGPPEDTRQEAMTRMVGPPEDKRQEAMTRMVGPPEDKRHDIARITDDPARHRQEAHTGSPTDREADAEAARALQAELEAMKGEAHTLALPEGDVGAAEGGEAHLASREESASSPAGEARGEEGFRPSAGGSDAPSPGSLAASTCPEVEQPPPAPRRWRLRLPARGTLARAALLLLALGGSAGLLSLAWALHTAQAVALP